ncbi:UDP-N-acetylmuramoyl-tripeptide--D-alanyl-D-alanine ligase [Sanguibacter antarcticus]|uniref:UDP-N-acetylmuramoyl-tripeptide--D-alanyl-D-alanine ligase n=1 Tax=Sanguibacter antarcticus TaxID=372484 RepID=A0A2A9E4A1_9MICO|nr:UDP-N-acetylmuramoyl-tripeptide--D-alanyl-D-alanine ligase [Sanguibacter antarcticus]PFG33466.1 UDP-N-acetylmuramoyl-tripeptide--D-alanyl-D-alanine ligase [Sanguibacter antarcticus]
MIDLTAAEIAQITGGETAAPLDLVVRGAVETDSRKVGPGGLFVAIVGDRTDGHDHARAAVDAGAALVLASHAVDGVPCVVVDDVQTALGLVAAEHLRRLRTAGTIEVVAVTGSVGKTTTKDLLGRLLASAGETVLPAGSLNNEIGLPLTVLRATRDTRFLVLEMGASAPGDLIYLTGIAPPDVSVVLAVGSAHLGGFGDLEAVARAKSELVTGLAPGGVAILNADDHRVVAMRDVAPGRVVTFGTVRECTVRAVGVQIDRGGHVSFDLEHDDASVPVTLRLVGEHHLTNALAAATAALELGLPLEQVGALLGSASAASPHRMAVTDRPDGVTVIDDAYNANPDSMRAALKALAVMAGRDRRSIAVLGEMLELGPDSRAVHDEIGRLVVRLNIKLLVVVGAGASGIGDGATQEGSWGDEVLEVPDVDAASRFLAGELRSGDVVLVKASNGAGLWRLGDELTTVVAS